MTCVAGALWRVVVLDENERTRTSVCAALRAAGYEAAPVATWIGLRRAFESAGPTIVLCDVSPPLTYEEIISSVRALREVTNDRAPIILCGSQSAAQLEILVRACQVAGFIERHRDPSVWRRQLWHYVAKQEGDDGVKLLLIDDSELTLEILQERLRRGGFDVRIALSLGEVKSIIRGWSPSIIVADVNMPDMRGDDLCTRLKTAAATRDAVVMLCSSMPEDRLALVAGAAGADGFVSKSLGLDSVASSIEGMYRRRFDSPDALGQGLGRP